MVLLFMMYVAIEWSDLVLYPVSFPLNICMGGNKPGNIGRFKTLTSGWPESGCDQSTHVCVTIQSHDEHNIPSLLAVQSDQNSHKVIAADKNQ